jgi:hypothetical protein
MVSDTYHLLRDHDDCLDREFAVAVVKEILQAGSEEINDQYIVESFLAEVVDIWYSGYTPISVLATRQETSKLTAADQDLVGPVLIS